MMNFKQGLISSIENKKNVITFFCYDEPVSNKFLLKDKKTLKGELNIILSNRLGKVFIKKQKLDDNFKKILNKYFCIYFNF